MKEGRKSWVQACLGKWLWQVGFCIIKMQVAGWLGDGRGRGWSDMVEGYGGVQVNKMQVEGEGTLQVGAQVCMVSCKMVFWVGGKERNRLGLQFGPKFQLEMSF